MDLICDEESSKSEHIVEEAVQYFIYLGCDTFCGKDWIFQAFNGSVASFNSDLQP
jgi:D-alanine-D-alanine ligase-like ATP-grasp enzyme